MRSGLTFRAAVAALAFVPTTHALEIRNARLERLSVDPMRGEQAIVRFGLDAGASAEVLWWDGRDLLIRRTKAAPESASGDWIAIWDARDTKGRPVPPEAYHYTIEASDSTAAPSFDPTDSTGGEVLTPGDVVWDADTGHVRYRLAQPARVNIRAGFVNHGPLLATIVDWVPRVAGEQSEAWDGRDQSNVIDLARHPSLQISVDAYALPVNTVVLGGPASIIEFVSDVAPDAPRRQRERLVRKRMHHHSQQPLETRGDIAIRVELGDDYPLAADKTPIVSGVVPVRLAVEAKDRQRAIERRFEPVFFVDGTFAFENEVGFLPMTWLWNTIGVSPGVHYLNVNLRGYEGNFGMATMKVIVRDAAVNTKESSP